MARNFNRNYSLSVVVPFLSILILLIAAAALAQMTATTHQSAEDMVVAPELASASQGPAISFAKVVTYFPGWGGALGIVAADLNGDGKPDLAVSQYDGTIGVLLGNGDGTFQPVVVYGSGGWRAYSIAVADVNRDGNPDLVVANCGPNQQTECYTGTAGVVGVLLGNGDGTFQPAMTYNPGGTISMSVAVADVDGDGNPDVVVVNACATRDSCEGSVGVLLGNGDGTFRPAVTYDSGGWMPGSVVIGDVNGDGRLDVVVGNSDGRVGVLLGNGDGTFRAEVGYPSGGSSVAIGDLNGDGHPDLVVAGGGQVSVLKGNGDGTFQTPVSYGSGGWAASSVAMAEVNGDGKPDLVVSSTCRSGSAGCQTALVGVLLGNGDGTFQTVKTYATGGFNAMSVAIADLNSDGRPDLIVANECQTNCSYTSVGVLLNLTKIASTTQLATSGSPSFIDQPVTFTAAVTSGALIPDGTSVPFRDGASEIGIGTITGGVATFTTSSLAAKTHVIKATYPGSAFTKTSLGAVTQVVEKYATTTALRSSPNPSARAQTVTFTATVTPIGPYPLTGKVWFKDGAVGIGSATLSGGVAILTKNWLTVGTHAITAEYLGDSANARSTSAVLNQVVQ